MSLMFEALRACGPALANEKAGRARAGRGRATRGKAAVTFAARLTFEEVSRHYGATLALDAAPMPSSACASAACGCLPAGRPCVLDARFLGDVALVELAVFSPACGKAMRRRKARRSAFPSIPARFWYSRRKRGAGPFTISWSAACDGGAF